MDYNSLKMEQLGSVRDMFGLKGKKALVTGAAGGIGRSCAHAFAELGADVALMDISSRLTQLTGYAGYLETKFGIKAVPLTGDVADEESVDTFMEDAVREFGTLDILFSNAGIAGGVNRGSDISMEDWNKIIGINLTGMLLTGRYGANVMKRDGHEEALFLLPPCLELLSIKNRRQGPGTPPDTRPQKRQSGIWPNPWQWIMWNTEYG